MIVIIDAKAFDELKELRHLLLYQNKINTLPVGVFKSLIKLELLDIMQNKLKVIESYIWLGLNSLQELRIQAPGDIFPGFAHLPKIYTLVLDIKLLVDFRSHILNGSSFPDTESPPTLAIETDISTLMETCNVNTCWLKEARQKGFIVLNKTTGEVLYPLAAKSTKGLGEQKSLNFLLFLSWCFSSVRNFRSVSDIPLEYEERAFIPGL